MNQIFFFVVVLFSAIFHEYMHGWAAYQMGDPTAKNMGRLTLNPIAHIDPVFTIAMPLLLYFGTGGRFMFAAAKPVPFNPYNLKYRRYGPALVGLAGPAANVLIAAIFSILIRFFPLPQNLLLFAFIVVYANILLAVFNLVPLPPLDGSHLLRSLLPARWHEISEWLDRYGWIVFLLFLVFGIGLIQPIVDGLVSLFLGSQWTTLFFGA